MIEGLKGYNRQIENFPIHALLDLKNAFENFRKWKKNNSIT
jgi:hypothetical protein